MKTSVLLSLGVLAFGAAQAAAAADSAPTAVPEFVTLRSDAKSTGDIKPLAQGVVPARNRHMTRSVTRPDGTVVIECATVENPRFTEHRANERHSHELQER